jgi:hypothetical protein
MAAVQHIPGQGWLCTTAVYLLLPCTWLSIAATAPGNSKHPLNTHMRERPVFHHFHSSSSSSSSCSTKAAEPASMAQAHYPGVTNISKNWPVIQSVHGHYDMKTNMTQIWHLRPLAGENPKTAETRPQHVGHAEPCC